MHSSVHYHFNLDRHLSSRSSFTFHRDTAIQDWRQLIAACGRLRPGTNETSAFSTDNTHGNHGKRGQQGNQIYVVILIVLSVIVVRYRWLKPDR